MDKFNSELFFDLSNFSFSDLFENIQYPWEVLPKLETYISSQRIRLLNDGYEEISENVFIGKNVVIDDYAKIMGPAIIGHNSCLFHASYIRSNVIIGENVHIGHAVEIKNSIILDNSAIAHLNYIGDSLIGSSVNVSGGTIFANWRFDKKTVSVKIGQEFISTGFQKFGAIVGDNSMIGVNSVLNPGTILGKNTLVFPLASVSGFHSEGEVIKR